MTEFIATGAAKGGGAGTSVRIRGTRALRNRGIGGRTGTVVSASGRGANRTFRVRVRAANGRTRTVNLTRDQLRGT